MRNCKFKRFIAVRVTRGPAAGWQVWEVPSLCSPRSPLHPSSPVVCALAGWPPGLASVGFLALWPLVGLTVGKSPAGGQRGGCGCGVSSFDFSAGSPWAGCSLSPAPPSLLAWVVSAPSPRSPFVLLGAFINSPFIKPP